MYKYLFAAIIASSVISSVQAATIPATICPSEKILKSISEDFVKSIPPAAGLSIAISNPDCGLFTYTSGYANYATNLQMTDEIKMPIASHTKPVLTALMLMEVEKRPNQFPYGLKTKLTEIKDINGKVIFNNDGKINLTDGSQLDLTDSDFYHAQTGEHFICAKDNIYQCPQLNKIDLHHLLIESSGLNDFWAHQDLRRVGVSDLAQYVMANTFSTADHSKNILNDEQTLKLFGLYQFAQPDPIKPTQSHNIDAFLQAIILERVTGKTLNELLKENILKPLIMEPDSMRFVTEAARPGEMIARRYAYLNTSEEVEFAIENHLLFPMVTPDLARLLTPKNFEIFHREVTYLPYADNLKVRPAVDMLNLDGQGFTVGFGAGGMIAQPKAYIRFYRALANGKLLSPSAQKIFNDSFLAQADQGHFHVSIGYGSNVRLKGVLANGRPLSILTHAGFVLGGESWTLYDEITETIVMITSNFSGYSDNEIAKEVPAFFVTKTPYIGAAEIKAQGLGYLQMYRSWMKTAK